jgi:hypothetical protein
MRRLLLATSVAVLGVTVLRCGGSGSSAAHVPVLGAPLEAQPWPFAQPSRDRDFPSRPYPDTWREIRYLPPDARTPTAHGEGPAGTLRVTPRVGIGPLAVVVSWHVPAGHGVATLTATQTDLDPPMAVCRMARDQHGRPETLQARWTLPPGQYAIEGCVAGRCVSQAVIVT